MRCVRTTAAVLALATWAHPARTQSYYARWAALESDDVPVATLARAPIDVLAWSASGEPEVRYTDRAITLHARVALAAPYTEILTAVGRRARLDTGTPWAAWIAPGRWARVVRGVADRPEITVGEGLPFATAIIVEHAPPARREPLPDEPARAGRRWHELRDPDALVALRAAPSPDAPTWTIDAEALFQRRGRARGWTAYDVWVGGIVVRGYADREPALRPRDVLAPIGVLGAIGATPWCHGISTLDARAVPAGTELLVPDHPASSLGRTHRALVARCIDEHVVELRETNDRHWVVRAALAIDTSELEPATAQWNPDPDTCLCPPPWPE